MRALLLIGSLALTSACALNATLLPVSGALSELRPVPMLHVKATGVMGNSGGLSWAMPDGEKCVGRWSSTDNTSVALASGSLFSQYGATYLSGYTMQTGPEWNRGMGLATCTNGRAFNFEFVSNGHGFGIGQDNRQNIYRFVF